MRELKIDPELKDLLPPLTNEEYKQLEKNIGDNGFDRNFPIMEWHGYIADGHNRYLICKKHHIEPAIGTLAYDTKEEVMEWMLDIQLGRRNLSPIQRIAVAEKYRPIYEKQSKNNLREGGRKGGLANSSKPSQNSSKASNIDNDNKIDVRAKLAQTAGVSTDTYSKGKKILDSDNEELKQEVLSGEKSINAGYKELIQGKNEGKANITREENNISSPTTNKSTTPKTQISEETKQICADLKTEKTKEYLDSIWDYKVAIIDCMNADFEQYYNGFVSILNDMENRVTKRELNECIKNAENIVERMLSAIEEAKKIAIKREE